MLLTLEKKRMIEFPVTVERITQKQLNDESLKEQLKFIGDSAKRNAVANWKTSINPKFLRIVPCPDGYRYTMVIKVFKERYKDEIAVRRRWMKTLDVMRRAANRKGWRLISEEAVAATETGYEVLNGAGESTGDPAPHLMTGERKIVSDFSDFELPPLTDSVLKTHFSRIYDREAHIRIIYDQLKLALKTNFKVRHHILLHGLPACAKSELFLSFIDWLGDDLIEQIDASTMTKAGLETQLLNASQSGTLKPILVMEEIEKCDPANISCLVQVMDARGKIQRVNARDGNVYGECKIIIWGTCNDDTELKNAHKGAIWSRFSQKLECRRPDRTLMKRILHREVEEIGGNALWVDPILKFCFDELAVIQKFSMDYNDPRFARSLLAGQDRILDTGPTGALADFRKANGI